jgi:hypothetical protein
MGARKQKAVARELPKPDQLVQVKIIGPVKEGYRRAGVAHSRSAVAHAADAFDSEQLEQLQDDPNLAVTFVDPEGGAES